jgi:hypothetical protein
VLVARFGSVKTDNDQSDVRLLAALDAKAVDFLVTEDIGLHRRANHAGLGNAVLTIDEALAWLKHTFQQQTVDLPYVVERKALHGPLPAAVDHVFEFDRATSMEARSENSAFPFGLNIIAGCSPRLLSGSICRFFPRRHSSRG